MMQAQRLLRVELTVSDLGRAEAFYEAALGFVAISRGEADPALARLLGAERITQAGLHRGGQTLLLQCFEPPGEPYPTGSRSCDQVFQHIAVPVADMAAAYARLQPFAPPPLSRGGPQQLPQRSGGAAAYKFRDGEGHPLELLRFPDGHDDGIDHSAIVVVDAERSIGFYRDTLGLRVAARQINHGVEQDRLDGLDGARVEVVALAPRHGIPHIELLAYQSPPVRPGAQLRPCDIAATRLVLDVDGLPGEAAVLADGSRALLTHDPDGHALLLIAGALR